MVVVMVLVLVVVVGLFSAGDEGSLGVRPTNCTREDDLLCPRHFFARSAASLPDFGGALQLIYTRNSYIFSPIVRNNSCNGQKNYSTVSRTMAAVCFCIMMLCRPQWSSSA